MNFYAAKHHGELCDDLRL